MLLLICNNQLTEWKTDKSQDIKALGVETKYTPRTNLTICTPGISPLQGACITASAHSLCYDTEKIASQFSVAVPLSNAIGTAATDQSVAK